MNAASIFVAIIVILIIGGAAYRVFRMLTGKVSCGCCKGDCCGCSCSINCEFKEDPKE